MTEPEKSPLRLSVPESCAGMRLDVFLQESGRFVSRHQIQKLVTAGFVRLDDLTTRPSCRLKPGQSVTVIFPPPEPSPTLPEAVPLEIVHEDRDLLVVNKPAGMVIHPAAGHRQGTLVNALLHHCTDLSGIGGVLRPGIVHRLDKDTSGLLLVAKNDAVHQALSRQFQVHDVVREYQGLVYGNPPGDNGVLDSPIGRHPKDRKKMSSLTRHGKRAVTQWRVEERFRAAALLRFTLKTGRTHQIRVHTSEMGHPIVGDGVYGRRLSRAGGKALTNSEQKLFNALNRFFLHAGTLGFHHPGTDRHLHFTVPLPRELQELLTSLRAQ